MSKDEEIRRLVKSVYKPVATPPEFKKRLLELLWLKAFNRQLREHIGTKGEAHKDGRETENQGF